MSDTAARAPRVPPPWVIHGAWRAHRSLHRLSGGRFLWTPSNRRGWGALHLTAVGRTSGQPRSVILGYLEDGPNLVTLAMNGWEEGHPAWWRNLEAHPDATVRLAHGETRSVRARAATGAERDRLWHQWVAVDGDLDAYAARRSTDTPVVVLEPRDEASQGGGAGETMRAAVSPRYGPPEVVRVAVVARPEPRGGELLVRVQATTVNRTDCGFRAGHPWFLRAFSGVRRPKRTILGNEFAGVVEAVGAGATRFSVGDRVFGYDDQRFGGHAEYLTVAEGGAVATIPDGWSFEAIAPATEGAHYALANLRAAGVGDGSDVLIYGASGAIGSAAVQLARSVGAHVTAVCGTEHVAVVAGLGADRVVDRRVADFTADTQRYDLVFDAVGKCSFRQCRPLLKPNGIWTSTDLGPLSQNPLLVLATRFSRGRRVLFPLPAIDREMVECFRGLVETGQFTPLVDRAYPLDDIVEAYRYVETQQKVGNVVIVVRDDTL
jgi:deazaflavin-dependent oxidoreductase (nitroreductase family)